MFVTLWRRRLTNKAPAMICSKGQFQISLIFQKYLIMYDISWESSAGTSVPCAAVVIATLRVKTVHFQTFCKKYSDELQGWSFAEKQNRK